LKGKFSDEFKILSISFYFEKSELVACFTKIKADFLWGKTRISNAVILKIESDAYFEMVKFKVCEVKAVPRAHQKIKVRNFKFEIPPSCLCCDVIGN